MDYTGKFVVPNLTKLRWVNFHMLAIACARTTVNLIRQVTTVVVGVADVSQRYAACVVTGELTR